MRDSLLKTLRTCRTMPTAYLFYAKYIARAAHYRPASQPCKYAHNQQACQIEPSTFLQACQLLLNPLECKKSDLSSVQVDNLRTNHRGTYVLKDTDFQWLRRLSLRPSDVANTSSAEVAKDFLHLPCSLIR